MAIEKVKTRKVEFTPLTIAQLAVAGGVVVVSLVFGYMAFVKWRFKDNLIGAYRTYHIGLPNAKPYLQAAIDWNPEHPGPRELLAKILCDEDKLDEALEQYEEVLRLQPGAPQIHAGIGVVYLKKADKAKSAAEATPLVKQAEAAFKAAGGIPEAAIGLGHCELILASKGETPRYPTARQMFEKIRSQMSSASYAATCTPDGLVDYYSGVARSLAGGGEYDPGATAGYRACTQVRRRWSTPLSSILAVEARRFDTGKFTPEQMAALRKPAQELLSEMAGHWKGGRGYSELKEPWLTYVLAVSSAYARAGMVSDFETFIRQVISGGGFQDRLEPFIVEASVLTELAVQEPQPSRALSYVVQASQRYERLATMPRLSDEVNKAVRGIVLNNLGWTLWWQGSYNNNPSGILRGIEYLEKAAGLAPDDYLFNRNVAVARKRVARSSEKDWGPFLEKARKAAGEKYKDDLAKVEQYLSPK